MKRIILSFCVGFVVSALIAASFVRRIEVLYEFKGKPFSMVEERYGKPAEMIAFFRSSEEPTDDDELYLEADYRTFAVRLNRKKVVIGVLPKYWICYP